MHSLTGDRFLKQFFGTRFRRRRVNPPGSSVESEADKHIEPGDLSEADPLDIETALENKKTVEANELSGQQEGSVQPSKDQ